MRKPAFLIALSGAIFAGQIGSAGADERNDGPTRMAGTTVGQMLPTTCGRTYRDAARGMSCQGLLDFRNNCPDDLYKALAETALHLRCPDELLDQKIKTMRQEFAKLEQQNNCAAATGFVDRYATDFELADAPELEKANVLRIKLCEQELREKELAALEAGLRDAVAKNDCTTLRSFEKQNTLKLSPDQSSRLAAATKQRCDFEGQAKAALRSCLDRSESSGGFCGGSACFQAFRQALPQDSYFAPERTESQRQENICRQSTAMRSCFANDPCGSERCSLPLRIAVGSGALMSYIERSEKDAVRACDAKREDERQANLRAEREAERLREAARAEARRNNTYRLTLCNQSDQSKIWIALAYYDYDAQSWIREGWWTVNKGDCTTVGDRFKRGTLYWYANGPGGKWVWKGDFGLCVSLNAFRVVNQPGTTCDSSRHRLFRHRDIFETEYTLRFT
ncbi:MAG TPA: DUF1036 domain-containing protein [Bradyrhizobium sp.]|nr:DUF1036 domain-containing protein [Bradyrhizobium sp.]